MIKKVRVGLIGYNFMGKAHSLAYRNAPFFFNSPVEPILQTIVGRDEERVKAAANKLGWISYDTDWRRVIEREDIDLIDIGTPNQSHYEIAIAALEAGKHVLCEKPLAVTLEQAKAMRDLAVRSNQIHMICHNYRFAPAIQFAKQLIESGQLGAIYQIRAHYLQDWLLPPDYPMSWKLTKAGSGTGTLGDLMSHILDLARFLVGEIESVSAMLKTFITKRPLDASNPALGEGEVEVDDASALLASFGNGAMGTFEASRFAMGNKNANRLEINGSRGSIRWDLERMNELQVCLDSDPGLNGFRTVHCTQSIHPYGTAYWPAGHSIGYEHTFISLIHELLVGIDKGHNPQPSFEDGYRNQLVLDAAERSVQTGAWVKVIS